MHQFRFIINYFTGSLRKFASQHKNRKSFIAAQTFNTYTFKDVRIALLKDF